MTGGESEVPEETSKVRTEPGTLFEEEDTPLQPKSNGDLKSQIEELEALKA